MDGVTILNAYTETVGVGNSQLLIGVIIFVVLLIISMVIGCVADNEALVAIGIIVSFVLGAICMCAALQDYRAAWRNLCCTGV